MKSQGEKMVSSFRTLKNKGKGEIKRKGSQFLSVALPIQDKEELEDAIQEQKDSYPKASHNAFAYRVGKQSPAVRYSDDGEPSGTAGMPLLKLLQGRQLTDAAVVVTRIFGGTLLGTGGLARAYSDAGRQAINRAGTVEKVLCVKFCLSIPYDRWGKFEHYVKTTGYLMNDVNYAAQVTVELVVPAEQKTEFVHWVDEFSSGGFCPQEKGKQYLSRT